MSMHDLDVREPGRPRVAPTVGPIPQSIGAIVTGFKSAVTRRINELPGKRGAVWQRNYWERVIRGEQGDLLLDFDEGHKIFDHNRPVTLNQARRSRLWPR
jgi:hypothetical protein